MPIGIELIGEKQDWIGLAGSGLRGRVEVILLTLEILLRSMFSGDLIGSEQVLRDAILTRYNNQGFESAQNLGKEYRVGLPLGETAAQFMTSINSDPWTMSSKSLWTQIRSLEAQGIGGTESR